MVSDCTRMFRSEPNTRLGSKIVRYNVLGSNIVILNSLQVVMDLLDKRSAIYSDR